MTIQNRQNPEEIFKLYVELDGNIHAMCVDSRCPIKVYSYLYNFCNKHEFKARLAKIHERARELTNEEIAQQLVIKRKEMIAICRAIFAKYAEQLSPTRKIQKPDGTIEEIPNERIRVTSSDVALAYKIFKAEIGEAKEINQQEFSATLKGKNIFEHFQKRAGEEEVHINSSEEQPKIS